MRSPSCLPVLSLAIFLGLASTACVDVSEEVVFPPSTGFAALAVDGCGVADPPMGRLSGRVYALPRETRWLPDFTRLGAAGTICTDRLDVPERSGFPGFPGVGHRFEWFGIDFQGVFVVARPGQFRFRLTSDDGSKLYVDGTQVIDNDGYHYVRAAEGTVMLGAGPHHISVPYWQGPGPMALVLEIARPGEPYVLFRMDRALQGNGAAGGGVGMTPRSGGESLAIP